MGQCRDHPQQCAFSAPFGCACDREVRKNRSSIVTVGASDPQCDRNPGMRAAFDLMRDDLVYLVEYFSEQFGIWCRVGVW
jgi:hypothetical protein